MEITVEFFELPLLDEASDVLLHGRRLVVLAVVVLRRPLEPEVPLETLLGKLLPESDEANAYLGFSFSSSSGLEP